METKFCVEFSNNQGQIVAIGHGSDLSEALKKAKDGLPDRTWTGTEEILTKEPDGDGIRRVNSDPNYNLAAGEAKYFVTFTVSNGLFPFYIGDGGFGLSEEGARQGAVKSALSYWRENQVGVKNEGAFAANQENMMAALEEASTAALKAEEDSACKRRTGTANVTGYDTPLFCQLQRLH